MRVRCFVTCVLLMHVCVLWGAAQQDFVTFDEAAHIPSGLVHWTAADFRPYQVNPPLARMVATFPLLFSKPKINVTRVSDAPGERWEWDLANEFAVANRERYLEFVRTARVASIGWSILCAMIIYRWASQIYGRSAGCLSLVLWCIEPNVLANGHLATNDIAAAAVGVCATYSFWCYLRQPTWPNVCFVGLLLGVALLTKFTLILLLVIWSALGCVHLAGACSALKTIHRPSRPLHGLIVLSLALIVVNLGYGFRQTFRQLGQFKFVSKEFGGTPPNALNSFDNGHSGNRFRGTWLGAIAVPVPADYLLGIDLQWRDFEELGKTRPAFVAGVWKEFGWRFFYLFALCIKVPLGTLGLILCGLFLSATFQTSSASWRDEVTLWLPPVVMLTIVSFQGGAAQYLRYLVPAFPFVIVATGKVASFRAVRSIPTSLMLCGLLGWSGISSISVYPHFLSYFNELAGGPEQGHEYLLDSNADWGQDLLYLKKWLDRHPEAKRLGLAYFGTVDPRVIGIDYDLPPKGPDKLFPADVEYLHTLGPKPGFFAVSVNLLHGMPSVVWDGRGGARALPLHEYEYFLRFRPVAKAGYSIFIYHVTAAEANDVRRDLSLPPL